MLAETKPFAQALSSLIDEAVKQPQVACNVSHFFGPGVYIKEARVPAGTYAIGEIHKIPCTNVLISGRVSIINEDRSVTELVGPCTFAGGIGRKVGYFHEDTIWQNIYATQERNLQNLDKLTLDKHPVGQLKIEDKSSCREHFKMLLDERGLLDSEVRKIVENDTDQIPLPFGTYKFTISASEIEGVGVLATSSIKSGELIGPARIGGYRTPLGRYTNHSPCPNATPIMSSDGSINLVAIRDIQGNLGGSLGEEITLDYRDAALAAHQLDKDTESCHHS